MRKISAKKNPDGAIFFSGGYRPFFLAAALFSTVSMALWVAELYGYLQLETSLASVDWHRHEMLFGYTSAVMAGFLFTAVPNWTNSRPVVGRPLIAFVGLWIAGRISLLFGNVVPYNVAIVIDSAFLVILAMIIGRMIIGAKNWRNLKILLVVVVFAVANIWFHIEMLIGETGQAPVRLGFAAMLGILMIIAGRITPGFTRSWLAQQNKSAGPLLVPKPAGRMPVSFGRYDEYLERISAVIMLGWVFVDRIALGWLPMVGVVFALLGLAHFYRLWRWAGYRALRNPLLVILHIFYGFIPAGYLVLAAGMFWDDSLIIIGALHVFGIGAMGGITLAVMMRVSLGNTGRKPVADAVLNLAIAAISMSAVLRVIGAIWPQYYWTMTGSGVLWVLAFGIYCFKIGPWLFSPPVAKN